jgi:hypothetical protein
MYLRLEVLKLAKSILEDKVCSQRNKIEQDFQVAQSIYFGNSVVPGSAAPTLNTLPTYSSEDIITEATKLLAFINK